MWVLTATSATDMPTCNQAINALDASAAATLPTGSNAHETLFNVCCTPTPPTRCNALTTAEANSAWFGLPDGPDPSTLPAAMTGAGAPIASTLTVIGSSSSSGSTSSTSSGGTSSGGDSSSSSSSSKSKLSTGTIVGIAVGVAGGIAVIAVVLILVLKSRRGSRNGVAANDSKLLQA